ncbi:MAG: hypothetical protein LBR27_09730 [Bifidobacteriaceae bacterium]|jgi:hypothetical protein|nr:hypothetical protein [Bifidobacteriaceae bacterium]
MRLKKGLRALWRSQYEAQIGDDPRIAVRIALEQPAEYEVLRALEEDQTLARLRRILATAGGARERVDELVRELHRAGLLSPGTRDSSAKFDIEPNDRERLVAEAETRSLLGGDGWDEPAMRARQRVSLYGLGRTGAALALALAAAGVGTLQLSDKSIVRTRDLGVTYLPTMLGHPRELAVAQLIAAHGYNCAVRIQGRWNRPDVAVGVDYEVVDPTRVALLASHGISHLSIVVGEISATCGPWANANGQGPCLRCLTLQRRDADAGWTGIAAQQHARSVVSGRGEDPNLAAITAAFALTQVLSVLAGREVATSGRMVTFSLPNYSQDWSEVALHPECDQHQRRGLGGIGAPAGATVTRLPMARPQPDIEEDDEVYCRRVA